MIVSQMVIFTIDHTDAVDLHNDLILIFRFIDMGTFQVGIKVKFDIIQYVYTWIISHNVMNLSVHVPGIAKNTTLFPYIL